MSSGIISGNVASINVIDVTVDLGSVATITTEEETFTATGVKLGDFVILSKPTLEAGIALCSARVSAADTVAVTVVNPTAGAVDAASETMQLIVIRPEGDAQNKPTGLSI